MGRDAQLPPAQTLCRHGNVGVIGPSGLTGQIGRISLRSRRPPSLAGEPRQNQTPEARGFAVEAPAEMLPAAAAQSEVPGEAREPREVRGGLLAVRATGCVGEATDVKEKAAWVRAIMFVRASHGNALIVVGDAMAASEADDRSGALAPPLSGRPCRTALRRSSRSEERRVGKECRL